MFTVDPGGLRGLRDALASMEVDVPKEMAIAGKKASKRGRGIAAKQAAKVIAQPQKVLRSATRYGRDGEAFTVRVKKKFRISMRRFKPKQIEAGVVVQTGKGSRGKSVIIGAFMGPRILYGGRAAVKLNGQVVQRVSKARLPIEAVRAVVVTEKLLENYGIIENISQDITADYGKQIRERIRFLKVKMAGKLRNQK
jgi:hypothetical protein